MDDLKQRIAWAIESHLDWVCETGNGFDVDALADAIIQVLNDKNAPSIDTSL